MLQGELTKCVHLSRPRAHLLLVFFPPFLLSFSSFFSFLFIIFYLVFFHFLPHTLYLLFSFPVVVQLIPCLSPISFHPLPIYTNLSYKFSGTLNPCPLFSHFSFLFHYTSPPVLQFHFWYPLSFSRSCFLFHSHSLIMSKTVSLV